MCAPLSERGGNGDAWVGWLSLGWLSLGGLTVGHTGTSLAVLAFLPYSFAQRGRGGNCSMPNVWIQYGYEYVKFHEGF